MTHQETSSDGTFNLSELPTLSRDRSFIGMSVTQFLGAFNDNYFKALLLLLATPTAAQLKAGMKDNQSITMIVFAAAFLLFSGYAGYLADRFSKRTIIVLSKVAEIFVMLLGVLVFYYYKDLGSSAFFVILGVLFLMGVQSAFFGPSKYGILPQMLRKKDLPRANGFYIMLTFLAIIFGTVVAGQAKDIFEDRLWIGSTVAVGIAILGTLTSLSVRQVPIANPNLSFNLTACFIPGEITTLIKRDRQIFWALIIGSVFWMIGGMVQQGVNSLGKTQLDKTDAMTSYLQAAIASGIMLGSLLGAVFSRGKINPRLVSLGAWGIVICLFLLALPGGTHNHLLGYGGSLVTLVFLGSFTGMFIVPIQVLLQTRPPNAERGRIIAVMNQTSWIGILSGAVIMSVSTHLIEVQNWPSNRVFILIALIMLPVALFYRINPDEAVTKEAAA